jgi:hypothetical protein
MRLAVAVIGAGRQQGMLAAGREELHVARIKRAP